MSDTMIVVGDTPVLDDVPVLLEGRVLNLPEGAVRNPDGSVTLTLVAPKLFRYSDRGQLQESTLETLLLHRLNGVDIAKMRAAKDPTNTALVQSLRWSAAKFELLLKVLDARDLGRAEEVVGEFLDMSAAGGLPPHAEETAEGVMLPMMEHPAEDAAGTAHDSFLFKWLTAAQVRQIKDAPDPLAWAVALATGLSPKGAKEVLASMDGADAMAMSRVVSFLRGAGRRTGG